MPGGDGTGPAGWGPMTGRAAGYCAGYPVPGYRNPVPGRWAGAGRGVPGCGAAPYGYPYGTVGPVYGYGVPPRFGHGFVRGFRGIGGRGRGFGRGFGAGWGRGGFLW